MDAVYVRKDGKKIPGKLSVDRGELDFFVENGITLINAVDARCMLISTDIMKFSGLTGNKIQGYKYKEYVFKPGKE